MLSRRILRQSTQSKLHLQIFQIKANSIVQECNLMHSLRWTWAITQFLNWLYHLLFAWLKCMANLPHAWHVQNPTCFCLFSAGFMVSSICYLFFFLQICIELISYKTFLSRNSFYWLIPTQISYKLAFENDFFLRSKLREYWQNVKVMFTLFKEQEDRRKKNFTFRFCKRKYRKEV